MPVLKSTSVAFNTIAPRTTKTKEPRRTNALRFHLAAAKTYSFDTTGFHHHIKVALFVERSASYPIHSPSMDPLICLVSSGATPNFSSLSAPLLFYSTSNMARHHPIKAALLLSVRLRQTGRKSHAMRTLYTLEKNKGSHV